MVTSTPYSLVPDLIEGEARDRPEPESPEGEQHHGYAQGTQAQSVDLLEGGHERAEHGTAQDHDEPEEDPAVRGGQQLVVAAQRDVPGHVGVEPLPGDEQPVEAMPMATAAQPGIRVTLVSPLGMRDSGCSIGHGRSEGRPTTARPTTMATKTPTRPQKGVHEASADPPSVPVGSVWAMMSDHGYHW